VASSKLNTEYQDLRKETGEGKTSQFSAKIENKTYHRLTSEESRLLTHVDNVSSDDRRNAELAFLRDEGIGLTHLEYTVAASESETESRKLSIAGVLVDLTNDLHASNGGPSNDVRVDDYTLDLREI